MGNYVDPTGALLGFLIPLIALAISLLLLYYIVRAAIISAMQRARREAWTETNAPEDAVWLTQKQRTELRAQLDGNRP